MTTVTLDDALRAKLNGLNEQVEVRDEAGRRVGFFVPEDLFMRLMYEWAKVEFGRDDEAARRAAAEPGGMTTPELIAHLRGLRGPAGGAP